MSTAGAIPATSWRSSTIALVASSVGGLDQLARGGGIAFELLLRKPEIERHRHHPRLRAVVEVTLDPAQLGGLRVDRRGPRLG